MAPQSDPRPLPTDAPPVFRDALFFGCCVLLLLPSIWSPCSITGQDEYFLSFRTVLEMQERSEWLTPYVNGEVRLQKPPLLYWLMRGSFEVFGSNLFAARLWSVLFGATLALFSNKLARLYNQKGYLAGLLALSAAGVMIEARRAMFDLPVASMCTAAIYYAIVWHRRGQLRAAVTMATCVAAAAMCKGPVALWFFGAPLLAAVLVRRGASAGPWWHVVAAVGWFAALALPWPLWAQANHPSFWHVLADQAAERQFAWPELSRLPRLGGALLGLIVPWSLCMLGACWAVLRWRVQLPHGRWLLVWLIVGLLPFAFMKTFERYLLGLLPPALILTASWLEQLPAVARRLQLTIAVVVVAIPVVVFALFAAWFGFSYVGPAVSVLLVVAAWRSARRTEPNPAKTAGLCAVLLSTLLGWVYPSLGINQLPADLPADLVDRGVQTFGRPQPGMLSMRVQRSVQQMDGRNEQLGARLANYHGYLFVLEQDQERVLAAARQRGVTLERIGAFRSFYSRKAWLKFYRSGVSRDDWLEALASRSPERLQPRFIYYRLP